MSIVSTEIVSDSPRVDGRRWIKERHTDHVGQFHDFVWIASLGQDALAVAQARVTTLLESLAENEIQNVIERIKQGETSVTLNYANVSDFRQRLRDVYRDLTGEQVATVAAFLLTLTDAQLKALFGLTNPQVDQLKTRLQAAVDKRNAVLALVGE